MSGQVFTLDQGDKETLEATIHLPQTANPGDVLTVQQDRSIAAAAGGGSTPVQAVYTCAATPVANAAQAQLPFTTLATGTDLLDRTTPNSPKVLADGTYAVSITVIASGLTAAGNAILSVVAFNAANSSGVAPMITADGSAVAFVADFAAGDELDVIISNNDGAASRNFTMNAVIVKLA